MEEKLIEAVRRRIILYDTSHRDYMKSKLKSKKWEEVAKEAGLKSGAAAKSAWEKLRHSLRDALRRQKKMKRSGAGAEAIKLWKYQKEMGFLQPFMANRKRDGNLQDDSDSDDTQFSNVASEDCVPDTEQDTDNVMSGNDDEYYKDDTQSASTSGTVSNSMDGNTASTSTQIQIPQATPKKNVHTKPYTKVKKNNVAALIKTNMEIRQQMSARRSEERKELLEEMKTPRDPLYHFFISMYETTKNMPPACQFAVRNQVYQSVSNMEATLLNVSEQSHNENHGGTSHTWHSSGSSPCYSSSDNMSTMVTNEEHPENVLANLITNFCSNTR